MTLKIFIFRELINTCVSSSLTVKILGYIGLPMYQVKKKKNCVLGCGSLNIHIHKKNLNFINIDCRDNNFLVAVIPMH